MDDEPHSEPEFTTESSLDDRGPLPYVYTSTFFSKSKRFVVSGGNFTNVNESGPSQPPGIALEQHTMSAFFHNSKNFVVTGGTFTNTNQVAPRTPSDFRVIPIGDLNLLKEIKRASGSLVVRRREGRASLKKMYTTRIPGLQSTMTAAVFQGDGGEELRYLPISTNVSVKLGSLRHFTGAEYENSFEFAFTSECVVVDRSWSTEDHIIDQMRNQLNGDEEGTLILENGWIRVNSANVVDGYRRRVYGDSLSLTAWLVQANHIFNALGVRSNFHEYALVGSVQCHLRLLGPLNSLPPGYLFLCPLTEMQTEHPGHVLIPACTAYWSRDPSGAECLSAEEAKNEGFPDIDCCMWTVAGSWDTGVYTGIRQFHEAKSFDPYSQKVATELGYPLFQVSCEQNDLFTHLQESGTDDDYSASNGDSHLSHSDDQESETETLQAIVLAGDTEINTYEHEDFLSDPHQTDKQNAMTPFSTPPVNPLSGSPESAHNARKRSYPAAFRDEEYGNSDELADGQAPRSKRAPILSSGFLPREALSLDGIIPTSFASSSRVTLDNLCFSSNVLPSTAPLGELDDLVDPLRDLDAAEVDAVMILSQLGARS
ncbi:hypothetical protein B0H11DRAFT_2240316 [Mycena galericulata]|nr:hypothetical protein B0H11DRAFT_2240316 [Mycena galericulata]